MALLALGMDERAASEADALVADHPWRERGWRVLVRALHRAGRQGEALRRAGEYRARLADELGLDPSPEFAALERDVATDARPRHPPPVASTATTPDEEIVGPLIGREADEAGVLALVRRRRLVTLLGPGGIGKTQLAFRVAVRYGHDTGVRTEVVELARVRDDDGVIGAVATQLDVQTQQGRSVLESVLDLLGDAPALLVLDNCEHVLDTIAAVRRARPAGLPQVRVLATSREPLGLPARGGLQGAGAGRRASTAPVTGGRRRRWSCSSGGRRTPTPISWPTTTPSPPWPTCAAASTASPSPSSWPPPGPLACHRPRLGGPAGRPLRPPGRVEPGQRAPATGR